MKKVIVIGSPGAGKSTFARKLRDKTGLPLYYLDSIWHKSDRTNITREEFDDKLDEILKKDMWIIDGNYQRTMEVRMERCDTCFLLDYPLEVCLGGARERVGKVREEMPWVEEELDEEFKAWITNFPKDTLPEIYKLTEKYKHKKIVILKSRKEADEYLENIKI